MSTMKKETKVQKFTRLLALSEVQADSTLVEFLEHEIDLHQRKNSSEKKPTKAQVENKAIKAEIVAGMTPERRYSISEIQKEIEPCHELSCQKISALLSQLITEGRVMREMEKRNPRYALAE